jgi:diguanylate cyclase (GGDEF)-like protein
VLFAGACYAAALVAMNGHGEGAAARWLFTMGTVTMVAWMTDVLTDRSQRLIGRLRDATLHDPLTGLFNRRGFDRLIDLELERGRRGEGPFTLVVGDLDHFKSINDHFGHHHGDQVLQRFSEILTSSKRSIDSAIRMGGEEFALILPGADSSGGHQLAERLRTRVREELADMGRGVSVSFGVATWPTHGTDSAELLRHGDEALYRAKTMGRDRTVIFGHELADEAPQA